MNKPYAILFFGGLAVVMGIGEDKGELIPSWMKLSSGFLAIAYGVYLIYWPKAKSEESESNSTVNPISKKPRPSYTYLIIGVLLMAITKYLIRNNEHILRFWIVLIGVSGFAMSIYGLNMFFKERRSKKDSGSID